MSAHVLLNLLNELGEKEIKCEAIEIKCEACLVFYPFFRNELKKSIIQEREC